ncbi:tRNA pseudouridine(13) synthase TruD [Marinospirillum alkaliphilum]|uniref:tRNA pseudouridine synthase D n=1 Tax=Marinospirillum alkaliphilum DSM 21637 TaxID=1122209 RepID=A0A1K1VAT0_9GAMM|nr:tRNA pseudouridine(13) synthase TruD [Marinospirillum alkaliphilum]SFX21827.1 tRNA pseudouridine13 synthase [Marinospirillum alkaliphilum DSM 21637]
MTLLEQLQQPLAKALPVSSLQGSYRLAARDFVVEETLGFEPEGQGEHLYLWIEKTGTNTVFVAQELARKAGLHPAAVSYSGLKDRHAVTRQWFCLHLPGKADPGSEQLQGDGWQVLRSARHPRKLKRGTHRSNHFTLRLELDAYNTSTADWLQERWQSICTQGVPNYFGPQRFGLQGNNLQRGLEWLLADPPQKPPRRQDKSLWLSAVRSALFNRWLSQCIEQGQWLNPLPGSCFNLQGTRSYFAGESESQQQAQQQTLQQRLQQGDLHPAGPLAGRGKLQSCGEAALAEAAFQENWKPLWQALEAQGLQLEYRPLRMLPTETQLQWQAPWLTLDFTLPSGCFATSLLRELLEARDAMQVDYAKVSGISAPES